LGTIDDVLELGQLERSEARRTLGSVDIVAECRTVADDLAPKARSKGLSFEVEVEQTPLVARSDPAIARRVLHEVIENAIKFTCSGGVLIKVGKNAENDFPIFVAVRDTGIGIDPEFLPKLGTAFSRGSEGVTQEFEGLGLGLALTRRYVALLGAILDIRSVKGQGTTVTISWPSQGAKTGY
jgi:signal transduction histidine kinase